jgi:hypothetical protein
VTKIQERREIKEMRKKEEGKMYRKADTKAGIYTNYGDIACISYGRLATKERPKSSLLGIYYKMPVL